jgi:hypothetical protein
MICSFRKQDVNGPCHNTGEMQQWADDHIDRCEEALTASKASWMGYPWRLA